MGTIEEESPDPRTGTHCAIGFALACGDAIPAGAVANGRLVDLAPTVLALLGRNWHGMDGQPMAALQAHIDSMDHEQSRGAA